MANPIDDNDQLAIAVGRSAGRWALVENAMETLFLQMIGTDSKRGSLLFRFFRNSNSQREVLTNLSSIYLAEEEDLRTRLTNLLLIYKDLADRRNQLLHNAFGYDTSKEDLPIYQIRRAPGQEVPYKRFPITVGTITVFAAEARDLFDDLIRFKMDALDRIQARLDEQLKASLETQPEPPVDLGQGLLGAFLRPTTNEEPPPPPQS